ncbi:flagellin [Haloimpatiens sp. FM7315]|uniref:flagellin n=1 Tax=Haloimpatiens sp. FM7315 TaxID=3298609 RepID=UPI0035A2BA8B
MIVSSNITLLNSFNKVTKNKTAKNEFTEKISSGKRINRASDDAAGLSISESMKSQIRSLSMNQRNVQDGVSMLQLADGALNEVTESLHRMKELSVQASNGDLTDEDRKALEDELIQIKDSIDKISEQTEFNGIKILDKDKSISIQTKDKPYTCYELKLFNTDARALDLNNASLTSTTKAEETNLKVDKALNKINNIRMNIGTDSNNLKSSLNEAGNSEISLTFALSGVEDINMATALMRSVKQNVIVDCNKSMLVAARQDNDRVSVVLNNWLK